MMDEREQQMLDEAMRLTLADQMQEVRYRFAILKNLVVSEVSSALHKLARLLSPLWE